MGLLPVEEALARVTAGLVPLECETVPLQDAYGRVLAEDVASNFTQPPFDASAMDGYAVRTGDIAALPRDLTVIGEAAAGHAFSGAVASGEAVRIFTGAPVPAGADTIVIQEDAERAGDTVRVLEGAEKGAWIRPRGFDFSEGDVLFAARRKLSARDLALAAAMNLTELPVRRRPAVAILATGDELLLPGGAPRPDQIISSIPYGLAPLIESAGGSAIRLGIARDTMESLDEHVARAGDADVLLTIGGASVGEHDLVQKALTARGMDLDFWRIAMRPGKPLMFGQLGAQRVLGVPGNPVSALVCTRIFLVPMLNRMLGLDGSDTAARSGVLAVELDSNGPRQHYMRATVAEGPNGEPLVTPVRSQDSSLLSPLAGADCLIVRPPEAPALPKGETVPILPLDF